MNNSIHYSETICNTLKKNNLYEILSPYALKYIITILISIFSIGYRGKTVNMEKHSTFHRTSISRFLKSDKWNPDILEESIKQIVINTIYAESKRTGKPIFCIIDDTIASKTKPSSKANNPIQSAYFHFSHLKKKQDYGHQAVSVMLSCNGITLNYAIIMYNKTKSKIDIVKDIADEFPVAPNIAYLLCDSWYVCRKIMDSFVCKGFYTVGALKTNRMIYPQGVKFSVNEYAAKLTEAKCKEFFHIVTVKGLQYYVYQYEGKLNGIENATVLISYPINAFGNQKALRCFISTNASLSAPEILNLYVIRWEIEVFFRNCKTKLALDKYQIRSEKGIRSFWLLTSLAYLIACFESLSFDFTQGYDVISQKIFEEHLFFVFNFQKNGGDFDSLLSMVA